MPEAMTSAEFNALSVQCWCRGNAGLHNQFAKGSSAAKEFRKRKLALPPGHAEGPAAKRAKAESAVVLSAGQQTQKVKMELKSDAYTPHHEMPVNPQRAAQLAAYDSDIESLPSPPPQCQERTGSNNIPLGRRSNPADRSGGGRERVPCNSRPTTMEGFNGIQRPSPRVPRRVDRITISASPLARDVSAGGSHWAEKLKELITSMRRLRSVAAHAEPGNASILESMDPVDAKKTKAGMQMLRELEEAYAEQLLEHELQAVQEEISTLKQRKWVLQHGILEIRVRREVNSTDNATTAINIQDDDDDLEEGEIRE